jgi:hypothetical protein
MSDKLQLVVFLRLRSGSGEHDSFPMLPFHDNLSLSDTLRDKFHMLVF